MKEKTLAILKSIGENLLGLVLVGFGLFIIVRCESQRQDLKETVLEQKLQIKCLEAGLKDCESILKGEKE